MRCNWLETHDAILCEHWPLGTERHDIVRLLNEAALFPTPGQINKRVQRLKLHRPDWFQGSAGGRVGNGTATVGRPIDEPMSGSVRAMLERPIMAQDRQPETVLRGQYFPAPPGGFSMLGGRTR